MSQPRNIVLDLRRLRSMHATASDLRSEARQCGDLDRKAAAEALLADIEALRRLCVEEARAKTRLDGGDGSARA